jgi:catechol 2,3-dioxygenase-like lactoylglutathione lyase family enzyme
MSDPPSPLIRAENLEYLRKQAKALLRKARDGDPAARAKLGDSPKLADALHAIAREAGFATWPNLQDELKFRDQVRAKHHLGSATPLSHQEKISLGETMSTNQSLKLGPIDQIGLTCTNLEEAQSFYADILGLRLAGEVPNVMKFFACDGTNIVLFKKDKPDPNSCIYFQVPGEPGLLEQKVALLKSRNVKMESDPHVIARNWNGHDVWMAFFRDPSGNLLALKSDVPTKK